MLWGGGESAECGGIGVVRRWGGEERSHNGGEEMQ